jgi:hypothetical protein
MEIIVFAFGEFRISAGAGGWRRQRELLAAAAPQPDNRARSLAGELDRTHSPANHQRARTGDGFGRHTGFAATERQHRKDNIGKHGRMAKEGAHQPGPAAKP